MDRPPDYLPTVSVTVDPTPPNPPLPQPPSASSGAHDWPPSDPVKLFVGQVPKHFEEDDLRPYLEQYGPIQELLILRNRSTRMHKGCAFVTYRSRESAELAQHELHDKIILPTMSRPLQVNAAGTKQGIEISGLLILLLLFSEELRKVFVGMLSKTADDETVRIMFQKFGQIEELTVLKDKDGFSRGCAFIKFATRQQAQLAINEMHGSEIMPGANHPLVVKYADTERERQARKMQKAMQQFAELSLNPVFQVLPHPQLINPLLYAQIMQQNPLLGAVTPPLTGPLYSPSGSQLLSPTSPTHVSSPISSGQTTSSSLGSPNMPPGISPLSSAVSPNGLGGTTEPLPSPLHSPLHGFPQYGLPYAFSSPSFGIPSPTPPGSQKEGPEGCNLFIYHLPQDYGDQDLYNLFAQYGNIVSAKVYVDKNTHQSKCFGFVSYDNPQSATTAIYALNGLEVGHKRLKVEHKKPKERKPPF